MKIIKNEILHIILIESVLFAMIMPLNDTYNSLRNEGFRWGYGYLFFFAAVIASMCIKKPVLFFPLWIVCSAADFAFDKKSLLLLAPLPVFIWVLNNVVEPINCGDFSEKKPKNKALTVNIVFVFLSLVLFGCVLVTVSKMQPFSFTKKYYIIPWAVCFFCYFYSVIFKSKIPAFKKVKKFLKRAVI